jgi:hypothetical protein
MMLVRLCHICDVFLHSCALIAGDIHRGYVAFPHVIDLLPNVLIKSFAMIERI